MSDIVWEDPPATVYGRTSGKWAGIAGQLREHPGKWALVIDRKAVPNAGSNVRRALPKSLGFEVTMRSNSDGTRNVYARYVGDGAA